MSEMNRRTFIKKSTAAATLVGFAGMAPSLNAIGASNKLRFAVIGSNGRGSQLARVFQPLNGVTINYVCDPDTLAGDKGRAAVLESGGAEPKYVKDFRTALEDKDIDAVIVATPDHWHTPAALLALQAGKHVYVEKPLSHNPAEGEMMVQAMKKYPNLRIQLGNQRRSSPAVKKAVELIKGGRLGRAYHAKCWYARNRGSIGTGKVVPVPTNLDWNLWQGPAVREEYRDNVVHYNWHWFWNWGTGESANNGMHEFDVARWAMGLNFPSKVTSTARRHRFDDDWEFWDIQNVGFDYEAENASISWEGHSVDGLQQFGSGRGCIVFCDEGQIQISENHYTIMDKDGNVIEESGVKASNDTTNTVAPTADLTKLHAQNLVDSIRGNTTLNSPMDEGHKSTMMCHYANIAQKTESVLVIDQKTGMFKNNRAATNMWKRNYAPGWAPTV